MRLAKLETRFRDRRTLGMVVLLWFNIQADWKTDKCWRINEYSEIHIQTIKRASRILRRPQIYIVFKPLDLHIPLILNIHIFLHSHRKMMNEKMNCNMLKYLPKNLTYIYIPESVCLLKVDRPKDGTGLTKKTLCTNISYL